MNIWDFSQKTGEDIIALERLKWERSFLSKDGRASELLHRISDHSEIGAIPAIINFLFAPSKRIHQAAADGIGRLLQLVPSSELGKLHDQCRYRYYFDESHGWSTLNQKKARASLTQTDDFHLGCLMTFHFNGHVRHVAVKFLEKFNTGAELRFLLLRQNDWVDNIANDAKRIVFAKLNDQHLQHFVAEIALILQLRRAKRRDHEELLDKFLELLIQKQNQHLLNIAIEESNFHFDKHSFRQLISELLQRKGIHRVHVCMSAANSEHGSCRLTAIRSALDSLPREECEHLANQLADDNNSVVREAVCELQAMLNPTESEAVWRRGLFDKSKVVRRTAQFHFKKLGLDPASHYRNMISQQPDSLPALAGLVEVGNSTDLEVFRSLLTSPMPSRRRHAIRGIANHGSDSDALQLLPFLTDASFSVVSAARDAIADVIKKVNPSELRDLAIQSKAIKPRTAIVRLFASLDRWVALPSLIELAAESEDHLRALAENEIVNWFNNASFLRPSPTQRQSIEAMVDGTASALSPDFLKTLKSLLSPYDFKF